MTKTEFEQHLSTLFANHFGDAQFELQTDHNGDLVIHTELANRFDPEPLKTYDVNFTLTLVCSVEDIEAESKEDAEAKVKAVLNESLDEFQADVHEADYNDFVVEEG